MMTTLIDRNGPGPWLLPVLLALVLLLGACSSMAPDAPADQASVEETAPEVSPFRGAIEELGLADEIPSAGKAIVVNLPAFELIALEDGEPVLRSRVIVGSLRHPTPTMETYTTSVRFRPTWRPTPSMVASGEYVDRRWPAGRKNPLGLAAIRLEPGLLIYLHDTNRRQLFDKEMRALSHGCIRVQRWDDVIAWLLSIDAETVQRHANGRRTFDMPTDPVPVVVGYFTRFPDNVGVIEQFDDIYRREPVAGARATASSKTGATAAEVGCVGD